MLGQLESKSRVLHALRHLLREWSHSFHGTSLGETGSNRERGKGRGRGRGDAQKLKCTRQLKEALALGGAGGGGGGGRGLVPLFPPLSPTTASAGASAGLSSTRPVGWTGVATGTGTGAGRVPTGRVSKFSVGPRLSLPSPHAPFPSHTHSALVQDTDADMSGLPRPLTSSAVLSEDEKDAAAASVDNVLAQAQAQAQGIVPPFSESFHHPALSHTPSVASSSLCGDGEGGQGDSNVRIVGSLARVVPSTAGREVVVVLAVQNRRR